jgi:hypothetical protein
LIISYSVVTEDLIIILIEKTKDKLQDRLDQEVTPAKEMPVNI